MTASRAAALLLVIVLGSGCAVFASKGEYADYRAVRLANDADERLRAMQRYVARHPAGHWYDEVQARRVHLEGQTFEEGKSSRAGLERYLAAYPDGRFVPAARSRLAAIDVIVRGQREREERAAERAREKQLRDAELRRTWVTRFVRHFLVTLSGLSSWGEPIAEVARKNPEFSRTFGAQPRPRCTERECVKHYVSEYALPVPSGTRVERRMTLLLRLHLSAGKLTRAELLLPQHGFSRWFEIEEQKPVADGDAISREQAVDWALARVEATLGEALPGRTPVQDAPLVAIDPPAIGMTGELIDTSVEDPGAPANEHVGQARSERGAAAPGSGATATTTPLEPEPAPDMVFAPVLVGPDGRARGSLEVSEQGAQTDPRASEQAPTGAERAADEAPMVLGPIVVPKADGEGSPDPAAPPVVARDPWASQAASAPGRVLAYDAGQLRVTVIAASGSSPEPAFDAVVLEWGSARAVAPTPSPSPQRKARH